MALGTHGDFSQGSIGVMPGEFCLSRSSAGKVIDSRFGVEASEINLCIPSQRCRFAIICLLLRPARGAGFQPQLGLGTGVDVQRIQNNITLLLAGFSREVYCGLYGKGSAAAGANAGAEIG
jgi:hypothetical protein